MSEQSVVVTGIGVISSIGAGLEEFETALYQGTSGASEGSFLTQESGEPATVCEVKDFMPQKWLGPKGIRVLDRSARLLCVAAQMALTASDLDQSEKEEGDPGLGLVCGTMFGSVHSIASFDWSGVEDGPKYVNPMAFPNTVINSPAGQAAIKHKLRGINSTISCGLASSLFAIQYAADFLRFKRADALLAGGIEELAEESHLGFEKNGFLSQKGSAAPFSVNRDGTVLGEGSALLVLETATQASGRGRESLAEIAGFGSRFGNRFGYETAGETASAAIREALVNSGLSVEQIGGIISSGSGSIPGDEMEVRALRNVFGSRLPKIPVYAPKLILGETLGASGALAAVVAALALKNGKLPPSPGIDTAFKDLRLSSSPEAVEGNALLINGFNCDGNNASLIIQRTS